MAGLLDVKSYAHGSQIRRDIKKSGNIKHVIYQKQGNICFILTDHKTLVLVSTGVFLLEPVEVPGDLWRRRLNKIRGLIVTRKIRNYDELIGWCRPGVVMSCVKLEWYL